MRCRGSHLVRVQARAGVRVRARARAKVRVRVRAAAAARRGTVGVSPSRVARGWRRGGRAAAAGFARLPSPRAQQSTQPGEG